MRQTLFISTILCSLCAMAHPETADSIPVQELDEITVEARNQNLGAEVSTYIPTTKQRNASQTASDLLRHMAIPQIMISADGAICDLSGKNVDVFIDHLPASQDDMKAMRMQDVKKVEYYDFPSDPRFQGKAHVVNFVMQKYEYGGYIKAYGWENTGNAGQASLYSKLQYKRMTFDLATGYFYLNQKHSGADSYEVFRLPQADGTTEVFERNSIQSNGRQRQNLYWPTFKALYSSDRITIQNTLGASFDHTPANSSAGYVEYIPAVSGRIDYSQNSSSRVNSLSYNGYWHFILNDRNSITFSPRYAYSHTNTNSLYSEADAAEFYNAARDNSHQFNGTLTYSHTFGKWGTLNTMLQSAITSNRTSYSGTATTNDYARTCRIGPGVRYSLSKEKFYGLAGFGYQWDRQEYIDYKDDTAAPWIDLSLQYSPNYRHSLRGEFHYSTWTPSSNLRSSAVIQSNPLMSYTGNPGLVSFDSYDAGVNYTYIPNNNFSITAYASTWIVDNRYVYDYVPVGNGILRTVKQPGGGYSQWRYGVYASWRLLDRRLQLSGQLWCTSVHNGAPYDFDKTQLSCVLQATYYLDNWNFSGMYFSPQGYPDGCMVGTWMYRKSFYNLSAAWYNSSWNLQLQLSNFARWNWKSEKGVMHSPFYDKTEQFYSINDHALARLSVTYTFGFGKKIRQEDEASQQHGAGSGILK